MEISTELQRLFDENGGILQTSIAEQAGISRSLLAKYANNGL